MDGLIELYSTIDYSLHNGLQFQADGVMLYHDHPVSLLSFSHCDKMLMSADRSGLIKLWNLDNGKLLRKLQGEGLPSAISWGIDPSHILVGSQDIRLYGIRSCLVLKEYRSESRLGGKDPWHSLFASDNKIYAVTNASCVRIYNYATQEEILAIDLQLPTVAVMPIFVAKGNSAIARIIVATAKRVYDISRTGYEQKQYAVENGELVNSCCIGQYLYEFIRGEDKHYRMNVVDRSSSKSVYYCAM